MAVIGIDIGSRSIERVVLNQTTGRWCWDKVPTTFDPLRQCERLLAGVNGTRVMATGYGRKLVAEHFSALEIATVTEIQAYAHGIGHLYPRARMVLDIGGQDTKVIALSEGGRVMKFEMNDRCAAGTGKFLEFMATALQVPLETFGDYALGADKRVQINSMCTVFAESEATSLMARGEKPENIAMGLHLAIVQRVLAMLRRVGVTEPVVFAGGVAHNSCVRRLLHEHLGDDLVVAQNPDVAGALGAALAAAEKAPGLLPSGHGERCCGPLNRC